MNSEKFPLFLLSLCLIFCQGISIEIVIKNNLDVPIELPQFILNGGGMEYAPSRIDSNSSETFVAAEDGTADFTGMIKLPLYGKSRHVFVGWKMVKGDPIKNIINISFSTNYPSTDLSSYLTSFEAKSGWNTAIDTLSGIRVQYFMSTISYPCGIIVDLSPNPPDAFLIKSVKNGYYLKEGGLDVNGSPVLSLWDETQRDKFYWKFVKDEYNYFRIKNAKSNCAWYGYGWGSKAFYECNNVTDKPASYNQWVLNQVQLPSASTPIVYALKSVAADASLNIDSCRISFAPTTPEASITNCALGLAPTLSPMTSSNGWSQSYQFELIPVAST